MNGTSALRTLGLTIGLFLAASPISAQIDRPSTAPAAGPAASKAVGTVFRVIDSKRGINSTGFQSGNGWIITTYSAVDTTEVSKIAVLNAPMLLAPATRVLRDVSLGLAAIRIDGSLSLEPILDLKSVPSGTPASAILTWAPVGTPVSVWGRPSDYTSNWPLLYQTYVTGAERGVTSEVSFSNRLLLFGSFDPGMSGSPVVDTELGVILGVLTVDSGGVSTNDAAWFKRVVAALGNLPVTTPAPDGGPPVNQDVAVSRSLLELSSQVHPQLSRVIPATDLAVFVSKLPTTP